jgi:hypothetical protein
MSLEFLVTGNNANWFTPTTLETPVPAAQDLLTEEKYERLHAHIHEALLGKPLSQESAADMLYSVQS